eukprot:7389465-Prymnesium_polylepis.3
MAFYGTAIDLLPNRSAGLACRTRPDRTKTDCGFEPLLGKNVQFTGRPSPRVPVVESEKLRHESLGLAALARRTPHAAAVSAPPSAV